MTLLEDRTVLITGAARGLGRTMAHLAAQNGARVAVADVDLHSWRSFAAEAEDMRADTTADEILKDGGDAHGFEADLTDSARTARLLDAVLERFGRLDAVLCFAGGGSGALSGNSAGNLDPASLQSALDRNLLTTVNVCTAAIPAMTTGRGGAIVTMSSLNGRAPTDRGTYSHYGVAKAAVAMYTRYLARDVGRYGIRANCIAPGTVPTGRLQQVWAESGTPLSFENTALRRAPRPEEICASALFLASDLSSYVTGQILAVDGGIE
ncbi:SDR family oxidoreductase [Rathayibacter sp. VKM Ac-2804]|uniref:SDR family NAD(P)-dependent oxidoreductase n=1 Tax=Rathayibacter sp. VKM Ac-2804 TaxID=2609257 RepID=UPI00132ED4A1|nr:SDR family NAD(P)-dependent oxidoreductase [Rathayibacter sp. VKM Ac-2804]QHF24550.1 SDR family oxidoreductase [Rathayibacter sp. VKM Ac-2804]